MPAALFLIGLPVAASAFKEGPYPNVTGGFGERSCHLCHLDNPINAPGGSVGLDGVPASFVQHNLIGSRAAATGSNTWTIQWTAPNQAAGSVQFNVAGNASNNDDSPLGDYIYLKMVRILPDKRK